LKSINPNTYPLVSVVIPFFNRIELTCRAVKSVFAQTYPNIEIIIINDGSTEDDSEFLELVSDQEDMKYIKIQKNIGPGAARNVGIKSAKGRYISFLDSDDTWEAKKMEIQIGQMFENGWSFSHTSYYRHDTRNGQIKIVRSGLHHYVFPWPAFHCLIATPSVVLDRSLLSNCLFRPDIKFAEDTTLWLALSKHITLHGIDKPLVNVFTGSLTTALDDSIHAKALELLAKDGLAEHHVFLVVHAGYRIIRKVQRKISKLLRQLKLYSIAAWLRKSRQ